MDGGALRLTASGGPSSGQCRPTPPPRHARRALDADRCAVCVQPVLFSAAKSICFSPSSRSQLLLEHAAAAFPRPAARSRPFDPAAVLRNHRIAPAHTLPVRCCRCAGRGEGGGEARAAPSSRSPAASWAMPGAGSPPLTTRSVPFDQGAVWRNRLFAPLCDSLCGC